MAIDMDKIKNRYENPPAKKSFAKIKYLKLKDGLNRLRILPFEVDGVFYAERQVCFKCGPKGWKLVPKYPVTEDCQVRQYVAELEERAKEGDEQAKEELKGAKPAWKVGMFVIDRNNEAEGPQFWEATNKCFNEILSYMADPEYGDISDPQTGFDITVDKTPAHKSAKKMVEYQVRAARNPSKLGSQEKIDEWLKENLFETQAKFFVEGSDPEFVRKVLAGEDFGKKNDDAPSATSTTDVDEDSDAEVRARLNARRRNDDIPF